MFGKDGMVAGDELDIDIAAGEQEPVFQPPCGAMVEQSLQRVVGVRA